MFSLKVATEYFLNVTKALNDSKMILSSYMVEYEKEIEEINTKIEIQTNCERFLIKLIREILGNEFNITKYLIVLQAKDDLFKLSVPRDSLNDEQIQEIGKKLESKDYSIKKGYVSVNYVESDLITYEMPGGA
jgi:hypothetical protein